MVDKLIGTVFLHMRSKGTFCGFLLSERGSRPDSNRALLDNLTGEETLAHGFGLLSETSEVLGTDSNV